MQALLVQSEVDIVLLNAAIKSEEQMGNKPTGISEKDINRVIATQLTDSTLALESKRQEIEKLEDRVLPTRTARSCSGSSLC